jgi:hypothetical protein
MGQEDPPETEPVWEQAPGEFRVAFERLQRDPAANKDSLKVLQKWASNPEELKMVPEAHALAAGKYILLVVDDWDCGCQLIERSGNRRWLNAISVGKTARVKDSSAYDKYIAAEVWWALADWSKGGYQGYLAAPILRHAREWYHDAVAGLPTGAEHTRALERGNGGK